MRVQSFRIGDEFHQRAAFSANEHGLRDSLDRPDGQERIKITADRVDGECRSGRGQDNLEEFIDTAEPRARAWLDIPVEAGGFGERMFEKVVGKLVRLIAVWQELFVFKLGTSDRVFVAAL